MTHPQDGRGVGAIWMLADLPRSSPLSTGAKTLTQESHELLAEFRLVSDLVLRINSKTHDQPNHLWRVEPAKTVTFLTDRKIVFQSGMTTQLMRHDVIGLPSPASGCSADVTGSTSLLEHRRAFHRR
jgi:hypothetical protein